MNLTAKIGVILLATATALIGIYGWVDVRGERETLQQLLDEQGRGITEVVSVFGVESLLLEDYPVLETVLHNIGRRNPAILAAEVLHRDKVVARYRDEAAAAGALYESEIVADSGMPQPERLGTIRLWLSTERNQEVLRERIRGLVGQLLVSLVALSLTLAYLLRRVVLERLRRLTEYSAAIEEFQQPRSESEPPAPHLPPRLVDEIDDEIGRLAHGLYTLHGAVIEKESAMQQYNQRLERAVVERTRALEAAMREAQQASQAKGAFLANMSHEIRTPMNGVLSMAELLTDTPLEPQQQEYLGHILRSGRALLTILNDVLDYSKIEANQLALFPEPFAAGELLEDVRRLMAPIARERGLELALNLSDELPERLVGDPGRIRQVVTNLVGNALKFTERGRVAIDVGLPERGHDHCRLRVEVSDTGIGIAAADRSRIFDRFSQVDDSFSRARTGTGLGLAICKRLVEAMEGEIGVESEPGRGSRFWFELPLPVAQAGEGRRATAIDEAPAGPPRTLLLVDDDPVNRFAGTALLERVGHRVIAVEDGRKALALLEHEAVDLVLMDVHMPDMDGLEATRAIRGHQRSEIRGLPVIGLTASVMQEERARYLAAGMDEVMAKPMDLPQLNRRIAELIGG